MRRTGREPLTWGDRLIAIAVLIWPAVFYGGLAALIWFVWIRPRS